MLNGGNKCINCQGAWNIKRYPKQMAKSFNLGLKIYGLDESIVTEKLKLDYFKNL